MSIWTSPPGCMARSPGHSNARVATLSAWTLSPVTSPPPHLLQVHWGRHPVLSPHARILGGRRPAPSRARPLSLHGRFIGQCPGVEPHRSNTSARLRARQGSGLKVEATCCCRRMLVVVVIGRRCRLWSGASTYLLYGRMPKYQHQIAPSEIRLCRLQLAAGLELHGCCFQF